MVPVDIRVRLAGLHDLHQLADMCNALWPESPAEEHSRELAPILGGEPPGRMPLVILVAEGDGRLVGFLEVGLRSHADGCDPASPVGYVEGWYVCEEYRRRG